MPILTKDGSSFRHGFNGHQLGEDRGGRTECQDVRFLTVTGAIGTRTVPVPCGKCSHCQWVKAETRSGMAEFELARSDWAVMLTLTIGPQGEPFGHHQVIDKALPTAFHGRIRANMRKGIGSFRGVDCTAWRYLQAGEYGELRGRAHYHILAFGMGEAPLWARQSAKMTHIAEWPWGHVNVRRDVDGGAAFYISHYMQKAANSWHSQSSGCAIGSAGVKARAAQHAQLAGLPVQDNKLKMLHRAMKPKRAMLRYANQRDYFLAFAEAKGVSLLALAKGSTAPTVTALVRAERWKREREARAALPDVPVYHPRTGNVMRWRKPELGTFAVERIKADVHAELRAVFGLPAVERDGRPLRPGERPRTTAEKAAEAGAARKRMAEAIAAYAARELSELELAVADSGDES